MGYPAIKDDMCDFCAPRLTRPAKEIDSRTPPCFIFAARDDILVSVKNAMTFADALDNAGINFELHIYSYGNHGFANGAEWLNATSMSRGIKHWTEDAGRFLEEVWGRFTATGFTKPEIKRCVTADMEEYLSVDCTVLYLEKQGDSAAPIIGKQLEAINAVISSRGYEGAAAAYIKTLYTLRSMMELVGMSAEQIDEIDKKLGKIASKRG